MNSETLFKTALILHISVGAIALFVGPGAMVTIKGGKWHRFWGKIYVAAMGIVALTAFGMAYYHPNPFLGMVGVFSFYLAFSGWRILKRKRGAETLPPNALDFIAPAGAFMGGGWLLYLGSAALIARNTFGIVSLVFAVIGIFLAVTEMCGLLDPAAFRGKRIPGHIGRMGGAYIATVTAFVAVNVHFLPLALVWLLPTAIGIPLITRAIRAHKRRLSKGV